MSLTGELSDFRVGELLQILSMGRKSGILSVEGYRSQGVLVLVEGQLVHAEAENGVDGEEAFRLLSSNRKGRFSFAPGGGTGEVPVTITRTLQSLLLEESQLAPSGEE